MEHDNVALARRWFERVWAPGGEEVVHELLHPQAVGHMEGGDVTSVAEFLSVRAALLDAMPDMAVRVDGLIGQGDDVAVRWSVTATHGGAGLGMPASQQRVTFRGITWLRFSNGQLVEGWDAWNQGRLMTTLASLSADAAASAG